MGTKSVIQALLCLSCAVWAMGGVPRTLEPLELEEVKPDLGHSPAQGHSSCQQPLTGNLTASDGVISDAASKPQGCPVPLPCLWDAG